jgi:hypothetical protein
MTYRSVRDGRDTRGDLSGAVNLGALVLDAPVESGDFSPKPAELNDVTLPRNRLVPIHTILLC